MPNPFLTPDVVEMVAAIISVIIAGLMLLDMRRLRRESTEEIRDIRKELQGLRDKVVALEAAKH